MATERVLAGLFEAETAVLQRIAEAIAEGLPKPYYHEDAWAAAVEEERAAAA